MKHNIFSVYEIKGRQERLKWYLRKKLKHEDEGKRVKAYEKIFTQRADIKREALVHGR